jgi:dTDP-4-dehydrorhamnose reductase
MKYAVAGAAGQLGRDLTPRLLGEVIPLSRAEMDLSKPATIRPVLSELRPDVVVNCAAYNLVDRAEQEPETAFSVNAWGVREMATVCRDLECVLVHYSTDYVFGLDATRCMPYLETDAPGPVSVYGLSKLAGEYVVRSICPRHYVIRTCGLYGVWGSGGKGGNFVETMLRVAGQGKPLRVVSDQICTPSYTVDVAVASLALLQTGRFGLYHLTNSGACSWHELAATVFRLADVRADLTAIPSHDWPTPARRPGYSVLSPNAYVALGLPALRPWTEAVAYYMHERKRKGA